jgi:hypothetical protein
VAVPAAVANFTVVVPVVPNGLDTLKAKLVLPELPSFSDISFIATHVL